MVQWQYCQLCATRARQDEDDTHLWHWDSKVTYFLPDGCDTRQITIPKGAPEPCDPFTHSAALLGLRGWELVHICHDQDWRCDATHAYFKRPVEPGVPIDEPKLGDETW
jgi:hypothetical protein